MDGESRRRGSVLLKGVRGFFLEIFEKSIDKHTIDAILNAPSFASGPFWGCLKWARREAGGFHGRIRVDHPDTESGNIRRGLLCVYAHEGERWKGITRCESGVFFEKC